MSAIRAVLTDERGTEIGSALDLPSGFLPNTNDQVFFCLRYIDPYGDTIFNRLQIPLLLKDLVYLKERFTTDEQRKIMRHLEAFCQTCLDEPHVYLRFIGD